ncbi:COP1-interacting protein 7 [Linum perenne]
MVFDNRCDLVINGNGKTEKIATGLVTPFLAHLKAAQDQMDKGGYSISLVPENGSDAKWFTKETIERFVFVFFVKVPY